MVDHTVINRLPVLSGNTHAIQSVYLSLKISSSYFEANPKYISSTALFQKTFSQDFM